MKSKISKEWYLIFLTSMLSIHSYMLIKNFIWYLPYASDYKYPLVDWGFRLVQFVLPLSVWFTLLTKNHRLLLMLKFLLWFLAFTIVVPYTYYGIANLKNQYTKEGLYQLIQGLIYISIVLVLYFKGKKYIVNVKDESQNGDKDFVVDTEHN